MKKQITFFIFFILLIAGCANKSANFENENTSSSKEKTIPLTQKQIEAQTYKLEILRNSCDSSQNTKICEEAGDSASAIKRYDIAIKYYDMSCKKEYFSSCIKLAQIYETAESGIKDDVKALQIYDSTCKKGNRFSCYEAGNFFYKKEDIKTALEYFNYACGLYDMKSCFLMAEIFEHGKGTIKKDLEIAKNIYTTICFRGDSKGCENMRRLEK